MAEKAEHSVWMRINISFHCTSLYHCSVTARSFINRLVEVCLCKHYSQLVSFSESREEFVVPFIRFGMNHLDDRSRVRWFTRNSGDTTKWIERNWKIFDKNAHNPIILQEVFSLLNFDYLINFSKKNQKGHVSVHRHSCRLTFACVRLRPADLWLW